MGLKGLAKAIIHHATEWTWEQLEFSGKGPSPRMDHA